MIYGSLPEDLGLIDLTPTEMMFWQYCPISTPESKILIPPNLEYFRPIVDAVIERDLAMLIDGYMYLTAKRLWVEGGYIGNRPGWHSDGFGTDDINYIWYDRAPTDFIEGHFRLPTDCDESMQEMERIADNSIIYRYPDKHLLRLDQRVIHRSPIYFESGMRTFVKISLSKEKYNLLGNSINHQLPEKFDLKPRRIDRNHPVQND